MAGGIVVACLILAGLMVDVPLWERFVAEQQRLRGWVDQAPLLMAALFVLAYALGVTLSLPGAVWMTLIGGYLFGLATGGGLVLLAATLGATVVFLLARTCFREAWSRRAGGWVRRMEGGFRDHAFSYLLVLRLVPVFPFWLVNLVPALLGVPLPVYLAATVLGIVPGTLIYVGLGAGLAEVAASGRKPDLGVIWQLDVLLPLLGLALLALLPVLWRRIRRGKETPTHADDP